MRVAVTGAGGRLGRALVEALADAPFTGLSGPIAWTRREFDLDVPAAAADLLDRDRPEVVVNAAAWTDVDGCAREPDVAHRRNEIAVRVLAEATVGRGIDLIQVSTNEIFDGARIDGRGYGPDDIPNPVNPYGESKLGGELAAAEAYREANAHLGILRTAWLYGAHGPNFVATMLRLAQSRDLVDVVDDQRGQPTWSFALAEQLVRLGLAAVGGTARAGAYHGTASGETTWFGLARAVFEEAGLDPERIQPTTSDKFVRPARRPAFSVLGHDRWAAAGLAPLPHWRTMLTSARPHTWT